MISLAVLVLVVVASGGRFARDFQDEAMRGDDAHVKDTPSYDRPELLCVDCPEYVKLSARDKEVRLWQHIRSDDYSKLGVEDKPWITTYKSGAEFSCYGHLRVTWKEEIEEDWHPVTGKQKCGGSKWSLWKRYRCTCSDMYPMKDKWIPTLSRVNKERARAWNGTMPMFYDRFSDVNPANNIKLIHSYGAVAKVKVVMTAEGKELSKKVGYTGMFADGLQYGLFRLSMVADFSKARACGLKCANSDALKPSLALKLFRDGEASSNLVAQTNLGLGVGHEANEDTGTPEWENSLNFFKHAHATWLPAPTMATAGPGGFVVTKLFSYATEEDETNGVGLAELASAGVGDKNLVKAPRAVYFVPTDEMRNMFSDEDHDPRFDFVTIPAGTTLYNIHALQDGDQCVVSEQTPYYWQDLPTDCKGPILQTVVTRSEFVASDWGDRRLFFQHERPRTKNGPWARKMCQTDDGSDLPHSNEFRMASDLSKTCTFKCGTNMKQVPGSCPYGYMENP